MYQAGELIKFSPFVFKNGNQPKPKYCIVLGQIDDKVMLASLPTSNISQPSDISHHTSRVPVQPSSMASKLMNMSRSI